MQCPVGYPTDPTTACLVIQHQMLTTEAPGPLIILTIYLLGSTLRNVICQRLISCQLPKSCRRNSCPLGLKISHGVRRRSAGCDPCAWGGRAWTHDP